MGDRQCVEVPTSPPDSVCLLDREHDVWPSGATTTLPLTDDQANNEFKTICRIIAGGMATVANSVFNSSIREGIDAGVS